MIKSHIPFLFLVCFIFLSVDWIIAVQWNQAKKTKFQFCHAKCVDNTNNGVGSIVRPKKEAINMWDKVTYYVQEYIVHEFKKKKFQI